MKNQAPHPAANPEKSALQGFAKAPQSVRFRFAKALNRTKMPIRPATPANTSEHAARPALSRAQAMEYALTRKGLPPDEPTTAARVSELQ